MKKLLLLALLALPLVSKAQLVQSAEYLWRVQICDLAYNTNNSVYYNKSFINYDSFNT